MLSLMNKCYRIHIACILFINMKYTFGMLLLKHPVPTSLVEDIICAHTSEGQGSFPDVIAYNAITISSRVTFQWVPLPH